MIDIYFDTLDKTSWLSLVSETFHRQFDSEKVRICVSESLNIKRVTPLHIVTLSGLIDSLKRRGLEVFILGNPTGDYIYNELHFKDYFLENRSYMPSRDESILSLWRVKENELDMHPDLIQDYLKKAFFRDKDLSAVKISLLEAYYNIMDHADARNNAWSMMMYDEGTQKLSVAVCDFGIGIPASVRKVLPDIPDTQAIEKAMEFQFTVKSKGHNRGMGLGNIKDSCTEKDALKIVSGKGLLVAMRDDVKTFLTTFDFPGTLIYYDLTLSHFDREDIIEDFEI